MKTTTRTLLTLGVACLSIFAVACSNQSNKNTETSSSASASKDDKQEIVSELASNAKKVKSVDTKMEMNMEIQGSSSGSTQTMNLKFLFEVSAIKDPLAMKMNISSTTSGESTRSTELYVKDNYIYVKNPQTGTWQKQNGKEQIENARQQQDAVYNVDLFQALADNKNNIKIEEKGDTYVIDVPNAGDDFQKALQKQMQNSNSNFSNVSFKNTHLNYVIDKKTKLPSSMKVETDIEVQGETAKTTYDITYSNVNNVKSIDLPEDAKNAQEVTAQQSSGS